MAKGEKTGGRNFEDGKSGNPNGRPKLPADVKAVLNFNQVEFVRQSNEFLSMSVSDLDKVIEDAQETVFRVILARTLKAGIESGDQKRLEFFLDRLIGKPIQQIDSGNNKKSMHLEIVKLIEGIEENS